MPHRSTPALLTTLLGLLAVVPAAATAAEPCAFAGESVATAPPAEVRFAMLCLVNNERAAAGRRPLRENPRLVRASDLYAAQMVTQQFFDHDSPTGVTLDDRLQAVGYISQRRSWVVGENLGVSENAAVTPTDVVAAWMGSAEHRSNVLDRDFKEAGLGIAPGAPEAGADPAATTLTMDFGAVVRVRRAHPAAARR